jgi:hypothetical protein
MKTVAKFILKTWLSPPYYSQSAVDVCSKISLARNTLLRSATQRDHRFTANAMKLVARLVVAGSVCAAVAVWALRS